jgi:hypothetical protein
MEQVIIRLFTDVSIAIYIEIAGSNTRGTICCPKCNGVLLWVKPTEPMLFECRDCGEKLQSNFNNPGELRNWVTSNVDNILLDTDFSRSTDLNDEWSNDKPFKFSE